MELKELERLLKLCRKQGVTELSFQGVSLKLGELPKIDKQSHEIVIEKDPDDKWSDFPAGELSPTQLMFYSAGGSPEDDPELNQ